MAHQAKDEAREERIHMEIIVDAHDPEEQAMGWYNYLDDTLQFPFSARCVARRTTSPLEAGEEVEVVGMAPAEDCGGVSGYYELLGALGDPHHHDHERLRTWVGAHFDSELFSMQQLNSVLL